MGSGLKKFFIERAIFGIADLDFTTHYATFTGI